jgi:hypothetical protein
MVTGRLDLDDDGKVVDDGVPAPPADLLDDGLPAPRRPAESVRRAAARHPLATGVVAVVTVLMVALGAVVATRPAPPVPITGLALTPVPLTHLLASPESLARQGLVGAAYDVVGPTGSQPAQVRGIVGPGIRASSARSAGATLTPAREFLVTAIPDCADPAVLDPGPADYRLDVSRTDDQGRTQTARVDVPDAAAAWLAPLRTQCWSVLARAGLTLRGVTAAVDRHHTTVLVTAELANGLGRPATVTAVDVADVSTIDPADTADLPVGATAHLRVRIPVTQCGSGSRAAAPAVVTSVGWAVGPVGGDPAAVVATPLTPAEQAVVAGAVEQLCGAAPVAQVHVVSVSTEPVNPFLADDRGVSLALRASVATTADDVLAGDDPAALTSDARPVFTAEDATVRDGSVMLALVWNARCPASPVAAPRLPMRLRAGGLTYVTSTVLRDPVLARGYAAACGFDSAVVLATWASAAR